MEPSRRKHPRYQVKEDTLFIFNHFSTRVGSIHDISSNGLAFKYDHIAGTVLSPEIIDLFWNVFEGFYLPRIKCKPIYSKVCGNGPDCDYLERRRCGVEFIDLSSRQNKMIRQIIDYYSDGTA